MFRRFAALEEADGGEIRKGFFLPYCFRLVRPERKSRLVII